ncbi:Granzyme B [Larimichthys crocea]|uniref:trypsin n=1 Tax=Larimichthys crocea TaxID=215358 RepID=A0A6G0ISU2_LARCR|nr:Granzyme B [Larimichthys crocea]
MHTLHKLLLFHVLTSLGRDALGGKIINGKKAPENSMLYMVSLQNSRGQHLCGGFLISEDFVLTAAHCDGYRIFAKVVLGTHNLKAHGIKKSIVKWCKPESYKNVGQGNDIMLLKLSQKVQLDNSVQTIQLPTSGMNIGENEKCQVAGWGKTQTNGPGVDELRVMDVSTINKQVSLGGKIINGEKALKNSMQYMVSLQNNRGEHECGGFLISEDFVLTAAHCDGCKVVLGTHNLKARGIERSIAKWCSHPDYNNKGIENDIRLLKVTLGGKIINGKKAQENSMQYMVSLQNSRGEHLCGGILIREDFVLTAAHCDVCRSLAKVVLGTHNLKARGIERSIVKWCSHPDYDDEKLENDIMLLKGDSGGPLVCKGKAVGIVSFNMDGNCTYPNIPNVYTDISKYLPWINDILSKKKNC